MIKYLPDVCSGRRLFMLTLLLIFAGAAQAQTVFTDFEFNDTSGSFTIGDSPLTATFTGGPVETRGEPELYLSGSNAWHVPGGAIAVVTFETLPSQVVFFFRNDTADVVSEARVFDESGAMLQMIAGNADGFTEVAVQRGQGETRIQRVEVQNDGGGDVAVEDFSFTVTLTPVGPVPPDFDPANPIPEPIQTGDIAIELTEIASGMTTPVWGAPAPGDTTRLFVADQTGQIIAIDLNGGAQTVVADVSSLLVPLGSSGPGTFDERGLLGFAFHPDFASNGLLYTYTSEPEVAGAADFTTLQANETADHQSVIREWRVPAPADPTSVVDPASVRELLRVDQPQFNHNGGALNFDADGLLYIAFGDGGNRDDVGVGHGANGNGRDPANPLGAILRIDPVGIDAPNGQYGIPPANPFVGGSQVQEIFAYGFRNPYRFSIDPQNGALWVADVGQDQIEEINAVTAGGNYGWNYKEGSFFFDLGDVSPTDPGGVPADLVDPIAEYDHDEGISVIGGFVYRGSAISALAQRYVFGDFGGATEGRLFYLDADNTIREFAMGGANVGMAVNGFAEDANGELYVLTNTTGTPSGNTGRVMRIDPAGGGDGGDVDPDVQAVCDALREQFNADVCNDTLRSFIERILGLQP